MRNSSRKWTDDDLRSAVSCSQSIRQTLQKLGLREAGGNYQQIKRYISELRIDATHFTGKPWNAGLTDLTRKPLIPLEKILVNGSSYQSYKLKKRLFDSGLKQEHCEECMWNTRSPDGRLPLELDHINGNSKDNRIVNLRVLCPNCHSLKPTHRGRNKRKPSGW